MFTWVCVAGVMILPAQCSGGYRKDLRQGAFLWRLDTVSLGKTKEMGSILHGKSRLSVKRIGDLATNEKKGGNPLVGVPPNPLPDL